MKLEFEIPDELLSRPEPAAVGAEVGVAAEALSGGAAPDTVAVTGHRALSADRALSAGAAEQAAGPALSLDGMGSGLDGGAAPQS